MRIAKHPALALALVVTPVALAPLAASADTVFVTASRDNTLYSEDGSLSNGRGEYLFSGLTAALDDRRALLFFDVASALPPTATVNSVTLKLFPSRGSPTPLNVSLHRVTRAWGEGFSNASANEGAGTTATTGDATWTHALYDAEAWTSPGGDFDATPTASTAVGAINVHYAWTSSQMAAEVQGWLNDPTQNFGWLVLTEADAGGEVKRFNSRNNALATTRPILEIDFDSGIDTGACCALDGSCSIVEDPGGACTGVYQGTDSTCTPSPCPPPPGACCLPVAAATCALETEADCSALGGSFSGPLAACEPGLCPVVLTPFLDELPLPRVAVPVTGQAGQSAAYVMSAVEISQQLHAELPPTTVWGWDDGQGGSAPGPTLEARSDAPVTVTWRNDLRDATGALRDTHYLEVDHCLHGAMDNVPRTVVHLHGGHVAAEYDGYPDHNYPPGEELVYQYPNWQDASTLWYHDHALGITRLNVYMGLAGLYLLRDDDEAALGLPSGADEIPLVLQDRTFHPDGSLSYPAEWRDHFFGDKVLVNGKVWPYVEVPRGKVRFRILNASNARFYTLSLSDGATFWVIGSDGGLLEGPVAHTELTVGVAERVDVVMDFEQYAAGTELLLVNSAAAPFPGNGSGMGVVPDVMKIVVGEDAGHTAPLPTTLRTIAPLEESFAATHRDFVLAREDDECTGARWTINGLGWMDITEYPRLGTSEVWRFINRSGHTHPMHIHLVFFQVLDRQPFEIVDGEVVTTGEPVPPPPHEAGWKDTVQAHPFEIVRVIARFEDFVGNFAYHCHMVEHEDNDMMRQFVAVTTCGDGARGLPDEECDDGNRDNRDTCPDGDGGTCQTATCGDGLLWTLAGGAEQCDDGNAMDGDGCDSNCTATACGNGVVTEGEECDDGNGAAGDGCDAFCLVEAPVDAGAPDSGPLDAGERDGGGELPPPDCVCGAAPSATTTMAPFGAALLPLFVVTLAIRRPAARR